MCNCSIEQVWSKLAICARCLCLCNTAHCLPMCASGHLHQNHLTIACHAFVGQSRLRTVIGQPHALCSSLITLDIASVCRPTFCMRRVWRMPLHSKVALYNSQQSSSAWYYWPPCHYAACTQKLAGLAMYSSCRKRPLLCYLHWPLAL